jgi:hypothetical protein
MPLLTRIFLFSAFLWLLASLGMETLDRAVQADVLSLSSPGRITTLHGIVFGWITQTIFGVAWWMFPPASREIARPRGALVWICAACLNSGLVLRFVLEPSELPLRAPLLVLSAALQSAAFLLFFAAIFPRIKAR